jgi:hypothetical protein
MRGEMQGGGGILVKKGKEYLARQEGEDVLVEMTM